MVKMRFEGGAELAKAFEQLTARVSKRTLRESLEEAAEPMRRNMSSLAPRAPGAPDLADNIVIATARTKSVEGNQSAAVAVGPAKEFFYGFFQEFGTVHHPAQPFMRPAFDGGVSKVLSGLARSLWTALASRGISRTVSRPTNVESDGPLL